MRASEEGRRNTVTAALSLHIRCTRQHCFSKIICARSLLLLMVSDKAEDFPLENRINNYRSCHCSQKEGRLSIEGIAPGLCFIIFGSSEDRGDGKVGCTCME